jgi:hypothetical protein
MIQMITDVVGGRVTYPLIIEMHVRRVRMPRLILKIGALCRSTVLRWCATFRTVGRNETAANVFAARGPAMFVLREGNHRRKYENGKSGR